MKKVLLTAIAVFAFASSNAQDMKFGAKGGLNFASITGVDGAKMQVGAHLGVYGNFGISDKMAFQPELLFSMQGAGFDGGNYKFNYLNIPLMLQFKVADEFSLEVGPQVGLLMSATSNVGGASVDVKESFKTTDFGLNLGGVYNINENMGVGLRYCLGLSQLQKELATGQTAAKNSNIQLSFNYGF